MFPSVAAACVLFWVILFNMAQLEEHKLRYREHWVQISAPLDTAKQPGMVDGIARFLHLWDGNNDTCLMDYEDYMS